MTEFQNELNELKGFVAELKADREATKEKERRESWTRYTSMTIVCLAVLAAVATQWGGKYGSRTLASLNDATYYQALATDQWSYYQAKSIKQNLYEITREQGTRNGESAEGPNSKFLQRVNDKIKQYEDDKKDIAEKARGYEKQRDESREAATHSSQQGSAMGMAVSIYQIAIASASICLVMKRKPLWFLSLALGAAATFELTHAWML